MAVDMLFNQFEIEESLSKGHCETLYVSFETVLEARQKPIHFNSNYTLLIYHLYVRKYICISICYCAHMHDTIHSINLNFVIRKIINNTAKSICQIPLSIQEK